VNEPAPEPAPGVGFGLGLGRVHGQRLRTEPPPCDKLTDDRAGRLRPRPGSPTIRRMPAESFQLLKTFFETAPAARKATRPLARGAQVNLALADGPARFTMESGSGQVLEGAAASPDFTLELPDGAVRRITSLGSDDVGEFGVEFFKLVLERDPELKVRIRIDAPTTSLIGHGYLGVLALGGMKVTWWLVKNGVKNPKAAIDRLRGR
jgi:hypothetical protein